MTTAGHCQECGKELASGQVRPLCASCFLGENDPIPEGPSDTEHTISGHKILSEIARGGMGIVYKALDPKTERTVALKVLLPHIADRPGMRERFRIEAKAAASLDHPAILPVYLVGDTSELPFMTMRLASGGSLAGQRARWQEHFHDLAKLLATLAEAVHFAHSHGILHRDIKPENILFDDEDNPYLSDFGLAKMVDADSQLTQTIHFLGTPQYTAPEVASTNANAASVSSDIWSLGALLHELLLGKPPFHGESIPALLRAIVEEEPALHTHQSHRTALPRDLKIICLKCLAKKPADRYPSAKDLAEDLRAWSENRPIKARPRSIIEKSYHRIKRNPLLTLLTLLLIGSIITISGFKIREAKNTRLALANSLLREAQLERQTGHFDRRDAALNAIQKASKINPSPKLRDELISLLAWPTLNFHVLAKGSLPDHNYSLTSRLIASLSDKGVEIRHQDSKDLVSTIPFNPKAYHIIGPFTPDDRYLIVRFKDRMEFRDVQTGELALTIPGQRFSLTFDPAGRQLAYAQFKKNIGIVDLQKSPPLTRDLGPASHRLIPKAFSPDGKTLAVKREHTSPPALLLINPENGEPIREVPVPRAGNTQRAVFAPDGESFFAAFHGGNIHHIPLNEELPTRIFSGHSDKVTTLGLINKGRILISQSEDETTRLWDTATAETLTILPWSGEYHVSSFTHKNRFFLFRGDELVEGEYIPSEVCTSIALPDPHPDYSAPYGRWLIKSNPGGSAFAVSAMQNLHLIRTNTFSISQTFRIPAIFDLAYRRDNNTLIAGRTKSIFKYHPTLFRGLEQKIDHYPAPTASHLAWAGDTHGTAVSWKARGISFSKNRESTAVKLLPKQKIHDLTTSPDTTILAAATDEKIVTYTLTNPTPTPFRELPSPSPRNLFLSDNQSLFSGDAQSYHRWNLSDGTSDWSLPHQLDSRLHRPLSATEDGSLVALSLTNNSVSLVDGITGEILARLEHPNRHRVQDLAITPDGKHLAVLTTGHLVKIWHLDPLEKALVKQGFESPLHAKK